MLREEHLQIRESVREFVEREVVPIADELDNAEKEIPHAGHRQDGRARLLRSHLPAEYGGMGLDSLSMAIVTEELSRGWLSVGSVMTRMIITGTLIMANGTEEQKQKFLPKIASGELLTAAAFTEPDVGSDTASMKLRAVKEGDQYKLYGEKTWCTFANRAHVLTVLARTNPEVQPPHKGLSILLVEKQPGDGFHPPELARRADPDHRLQGHEVLLARLRRLRLSAREPPRRRRGAGLLSADGDLRVRAHPDGGARSRHRAGVVRGGAQVRAGAHAVRPADRRLPGHPPQAGARRRRDRGGAAAHLLRLREEGLGRALAISRRAWPRCSPPRWPSA